MGRHSAPDSAESVRVPLLDGQPALAVLSPSLVDLAPVTAVAPERAYPARPPSAPNHSEHTQPIPVLPTQRQVTVSMPVAPVAPEPPVERMVATPVYRIQPIRRLTRLPEMPLTVESPLATGELPVVIPPDTGDAAPRPKTAWDTAATGLPVTPVVVPPVAEPAGTRVPRLLAGWVEDGRTADLAEHVARHGELPKLEFAGRAGAARLVELVVRAGLRGRGGAGFPTGRKMVAVREAVTAKRAAVVVANGCEGDLTSGKDSLLVHAAPHLVLDGVALAAHAVGADQGILCLHRGSPALEAMERAIAERVDDPCQLHLVTTPERYVSSEASALVNFLTTGEARPTTGPLPSERGVQGRPTLLDNVETLAQLALLARRGADWFRERGTASSPGTMLVTVDGPVRRPGVYEVDLGTPAGQLVRMAGGASGPVQAMLLGGLGGAWLPLPASGNLALGYDECRAEGVALGVASLVLLPVDACGLGVAAEIAGYLAGESAGQCGPCMFGLPSMAQDLSAVAEGRIDDELSERLGRRLGVIPRRGACAHPDGVVRMAESALRVFAEDLAGHLAGRPCGRPVAAAFPLLDELPGAEGGWR
jgi:NADH:ubiquinone oxidoreductase subunit F (NADH-binding)